MLAPLAGQGGPGPPRSPPSPGLGASAKVVSGGTLICRAARVGKGADRDRAGPGGHYGLVRAGSTRPLAFKPRGLAPPMPLIANLSPASVDKVVDKARRIAQRPRQIRAGAVVVTDWPPRGLAIYISMLG